MPKKRDYKAEYAKYQGTEEQKKNRAKRNAARRKAAKDGIIHTYQGKCVLCHRSPGQHNVVLHVDHIIPKSKNPNLGS